MGAEATDTAEQRKTSTEKVLVKRGQSSDACRRLGTHRWVSGFESAREIASVRDQ